MFLIPLMMKVSIQGESGSFHEVAARDFFSNETVDILPCSTFERTIEAARNGEVDFAVMAIENARAGSILSNYTLIRESGLKILGEVNLRIIQNLMALPGQKLSDIREIHSHPIAFSQCMQFLNNHPDIILVESEDTAASARHIKENNLKGIGALASAHAAEMFGLEILAPGIETYKMNYTRFVIVGSEGKIDITGNKVSVCFMVDHAPGSLAAVLVRLAALNINLTKIQSVPYLNGSWRYLFYLDLEIPEILNIGDVTNELENLTTNLEVLGVYKKGDQIYES
jgi:prephenate dehydratase